MVTCLRTWCFIAAEVFHSQGYLVFWKYVLVYIFNFTLACFLGVVLFFLNCPILELMPYPSAHHYCHLPSPLVACENVHRRVDCHNVARAISMFNVTFSLYWMLKSEPWAWLTRPQQTVAMQWQNRFLHNVTELLILFVTFSSLHVPVLPALNCSMYIM